MEARLYLFFLMMLYASTGLGQDNSHIIDLTKDGKKDTIICLSATHKFIMKYKANDKQIEKETLFFDGFGDGISNISLGKRNNLLWFAIRFAPKYIDQDTLWFSYNKRKADWQLIKMSTYRFNTIDPKLVSQTCNFVLTQKIWLLTDRYEQVQKLAGQKKYRVNERCTSKQEH